MPVPPIDAFEHPPNPFIIEPSKLLKAATSLSRPETTREKQEAKVKGPIDNSQHFVISTRQIIALIARFKMRSFTYDELRKFPLSLLNPEEKDFINYLRRNRHVFDRIAKLDQDPDSISVDDIKIAARLAGDALVLSDEDLEYLKEAPIQKPAPLEEDEEEGAKRSKKLQTQDLIDTVQKLNPKMRFEELMALDIEQARLRGRARRSMEFLQSPTVSKVLEKVVQPYNGILTPEALRVLTSLLWNPAIYGAAPVVFFRMAPMAHETDIEPLAGMATVDSVDDHKHNVRSRRRKPTFHLEAHHIMNICHKLSPGDGRVSLKQLRKYKPQNLDEEKALNLLRQTNIFQALANLDHDPESLSDDDIQLALAEGNIVLSDPYMILVIQP
jgi:hypothetical protein